MLFDVTDETTISHFFALRYRRFFLEEDGVSAVDLVADTLCKSPELVGEGFLQISFSSPLMRWRYSWAWLVMG